MSLSGVPYQLTLAVSGWEKAPAFCQSAPLPCWAGSGTDDRPETRPVFFCLHRRLRRTTSAPLDGKGGRRLQGGNTLPQSAMNLPDWNRAPRVCSASQAGV
jgi:hypothetical protein